MEPIVSSFASLGVPADLVAVLSANGIDEPFPIQAATLADALQGRDVSGRAPTGSGKTIAFGLPLVARVGKARPRHPRALVLVPTRELAIQVSDELQQLGEPRGLVVSTVYGGTGFEKQLRQLRNGCEVVVATPGRLEDLLARKEINLSEVDIAVLDEADRMADMGFLPVVRRILDLTARKRQTLLFSATLDGDVDVLVRHYQTDPVRHEVAHDEDATGDVRHLYWKTASDKRVDVTRDLIVSHGPTVVFTRTKHGADRLAKRLNACGVDAVAVHGDRSQGQRERALADFTDGRALALVATDVAARGIHVDGVACVIHFDPPEDPKDYVHRSGRTGRAGNDGLVVTLVSPDRKVDIRPLQKALGVPQVLAEVDIEGAKPAVAPVRRIVAAAPRPATTSGRPGGGGGRRSPHKGSRGRTRSERDDRSGGGSDRPSSGGRPGSSRSAGGKPSGGGAKGSGGSGGSGRNSAGGGGGRPASGGRAGGGRSR